MFPFSHFRELFWQSVDVADSPNSCWLWKRQLNKKGYGLIGWARSPENFAHRMAYRLFVGRIPRNLRILHTCDIRRCVNWNHLYAGTLAENAIDMARAGTQRCQKLSCTQVLEIRRLRASGLAHWEIADKFGLALPHVYHIVSRDIWRHLP